MRLWWIPIAIVACVTAYGFYPGLMSPDALFQYAQMKSGQISNLHPPMMAWIWRGTDRIIEGPAGLYMFYMTLYLLAAASIARHLFERWHKRASCFSMLLLPPITAVLMTVWKDSLMLAALMSAVASILCLQRSQEGRWFLLGIGSLWLAATLRHNALPALLPLVFILFYHLPQLKVSWAHMIAKTLAVMAIFALSVPVVEHQAGVTRIAMLPTVALWDMAAISVAEKQMLLPPYALGWQGMTLERLNQLYSPVSNVPLCQYTSGVGREVLCLEEIPLRRGQGLAHDKVSTLTEDWLSLIEQYPQAYLHHRWNLTLHLLGIRQDPTLIGFNVASAQPSMLSGEWYRGPDAATLSIEPFEATSMRGKMLTTGFQLLRLQTPLLSTWPYLIILCLTTVCFAMVQRHNPLRATALAICASGWMMLIPLFFIAPNPQLRYTVWPIVCAVLTLLMLRRVRRKKYQSVRQKVESMMGSA